MGKSSNSNSNSETSHKMGSVNVSNPYYKTTTGEDGRVNTSLAKGTALYTTNKYVNNNIGKLLKQYNKPNLNDPQLQANLALYKQNLADTADENLSNNILNPLLTNNMIRSSQATNMYNNMNNQMQKNISDYSKELIANARDLYGSMIDRYQNLYSDIVQGSAANQNTAINAALGTNTTATSSNSKAK